MGAPADVPGAYDLVIAVNGGATTGFLFDDALESSLPFRTHRATYAYSPTFIERSNVQGDYGDNQQDFFMTATQRDWSLGEQQRYYRANDGTASSRYWDGQQIDVTRPGQVMIRPTRGSLASGTIEACISPGPVAAGGVMSIVVASSTNLRTIDDSLTVTDRGAHGLGATPSLWGICSDYQNIYLSTSSAGSVGTRRWSGTAFSTFSASAMDSLVFLDNTLYGMKTGGNFGRFDTAGTFTQLFAFADATGAAAGGGLVSKLFTFGGKVGILYDPSPSTLTGSGHTSLWFYDGTGVSIATSFPGGFRPYDVCVAGGVVYVSGTVAYRSGRLPIIYSYANGQLSVLWKLEPADYVTDAAAPALTPWEGGLLFTAAHSQLGSDTSGSLGLNYYNAETGGTSNVSCGWSPLATDTIALGTTGTTVFGMLPGSATVSAFSNTITTSVNAYLKNSLFDFDSSLNKIFRGITVIFDSATDGDGGSVDVWYKTDSVEGSYTSLVTGAASGTENLLSNVSGRALSVKLKLNKGTSTLGPVVKKILVRAVPVLTRYRSREYILDCSGDPGTNNKRPLRNGDIHPLSGRAQVDALVTAVEALKTNASAFLSITDRLGTYTGIVETLEVYEEHPSQKPNAGKSGSFTVKITTREI